jgi:hypothetical protein
VSCGTLEAFRRWLLTYTFPSRLPDPDHLTVLAPPGVVRAASTRPARPRRPGRRQLHRRRCPSPPHDSRAPRGAQFRRPTAGGLLRVEVAPDQGRQRRGHRERDRHPGPTAPNKVREAGGAHQPLHSHARVHPPVPLTRRRPRSMKPRGRTSGATLLTRPLVLAAVRATAKTEPPLAPAHVLDVIDRDDEFPSTEEMRSEASFAALAGTSPSTPQAASNDATGSTAAATDNSTGLCTSSPSHESATTPRPAPTTSGWSPLARRPRKPAAASSGHSPATSTDARDVDAPLDTIEASVIGCPSSSEWAGQDSNSPANPAFPGAVGAPVGARRARNRSDLTRLSASGVVRSALSGRRSRAGSAAPGSACRRRARRRATPPSPSQPQRALPRERRRPRSRPRGRGCRRRSRRPPRCRRR